MQYFNTFLTWIMNGCYSLCGSYGLAIIWFTFISKIILLPVSLWTYFNSITMIKIQPDINLIKAKYYGQKDQIAELEAKLYKGKGYHPLASTIPLIIQLILLMGVVEVIKAGIANPEIDMNFGPVNLGLVPGEVGMSLIWSPIVAGFASWLLCIAQNASNVLQSEQSKFNKFGTMFISVGLSLYLGWFVAIGTALYWVASNLFAVLQLYLCNWIIRPRRYIDYEKLEESRRQLSQMQGIGTDKKKLNKEYFQNKKKERKDYKRFFSVVNKHLVFYSESNGFYKYFKGFIEYILEHTNITIHYITSDPNDNIFQLAEQNNQIRAYYIGENRLITLMMKMDADVVVMTMPDLGNYHIKRSYVRDDIEYIFVQHGMGSNNMGMRKGHVEHFDTVFCAGPHQVAEEAETEELYGYKKKNLIEVGYPLIDELRQNYEYRQNIRKQILIAPSWQKDNIIDSCLEEILDQLKDMDAQIIVRPHPQEVRQKQGYMDTLKNKYASSPNIEIQTDFTSNNPLMESDLLITDWSGISWEYAFTTLRPVLFINTPMKVMNPDYEKIATVPLNILLRNQLGKSLEMNQLDRISETAEELLSKTNEYSKQIEELANEYIYNHGTSAEAGGKYIIEAVRKQISRKENLAL